MTTKRVGVVLTGTANLASVLAGLKRAGTEPYLIESQEQVRDATQLVLPGVGAFGAAMEKLRHKGLVEALQERLEAERSTLAICLGHQLLCRASEETPGVEGLGLLDQTVIQFPKTLRVPQFGWSMVTPQEEGGFFRPGYAYFANSYCLAASPEGWEVATSEYGHTYVATMRKGAIVSCQFHPELSSDWGHDLLTRWLQL